MGALEASEVSDYCAAAWYDIDEGIEAAEALSLVASIAMKDTVMSCTLSTVGACVVVGVEACASDVVMSGVDLVRRGSVGLFM